MLLSVDKTLQLLAEGKTIEKIASLASCEEADVISIIEKARALLLKHEKEDARRKIVIRKKIKPEAQSSKREDSGLLELKKYFDHIELTAVPYGDALIIDIASVCEKTPGEAAIGLILYDKNNVQVGKLTACFPHKNKNVVSLVGILRALKLAANYKCARLMIRSDSEYAVKLIKKIIQDKNVQILSLLSQIDESSARITGVKIEYASDSLTEKAGYMARKAIQEKAAKKIGKKIGRDTGAR